VVLESDEGKSKTIVFAEEEFHGDPDSILRVGFIENGERFNVANHGVVTTILADLSGEFIPDSEPFTPVFIDLSTADFKGNVVDKGMAKRSDPGPFSTTVGRGRITGRYYYAEIGFGD